MTSTEAQAEEAQARLAADVGSRRGSHVRRAVAGVVSALIVALVVVSMGGGGAQARKKRPPSGTIVTTSTRVIPTLPARTTLVASATTRRIPGLPARTTSPARTSPGTTSDPRLRRIGFRSEQRLRDHYAKHGREFGTITMAQYLAMAQDLRDAPLSSTVLQARQVGGSISRFDRRTGAFIAFDPDRTIRTFFRPDDGEAYFRRAAKTSH